MGKVSAELSKKRGEKVKQLLRENRMRQIDLANKIHVTPEHLNAVLNGKRTFHEELAKAIADVFNVRYEWIAGYDDFRTKDDYNEAPLKKIIANACDKRTVFSAMLFALGYDKSVLDYSDYADTTLLDIEGMCPEDFAEYLVGVSQQVDKIEYSFQKNGKEEGRCTAHEYESLINEVFEFVEFKMDKICKKGRQNG